MLLSICICYSVFTDGFVLSTLLSTPQCIITDSRVLYISYVNYSLMYRTYTWMEFRVVVFRCNMGINLDKLTMSGTLWCTCRTARAYISMCFVWRKYKCINYCSLIIQKEIWHGLHKSGDIPCYLCRYSQVWSVRIYSNFTHRGLHIDLFSYWFNYRGAHLSVYFVWLTRECI